VKNKYSASTNQGILSDRRYSLHVSSLRFNVVTSLERSDGRFSLIIKQILRPVVPR